MLSDRTSGLFIFILLLGILEISVHGEKEHVHFKIYVPEIIKHHLHTNTIVIHHHHHAPKKKKKVLPKKHAHLHTHHDDYMNWHTHNSYTNYGDDTYNDTPRSQGEPPIEPPIIPFYDDYRGGPSTTEDTSQAVIPIENNTEQYNQPHQYEVHEAVNDIPHNNDLDSYEQEYEQGHKGGHEVQTGHLYTNELKQYYDDKIEESGEAFVDGSNEEHYGYHNNDRHPRMIYY